MMRHLLSRNPGEQIAVQTQWLTYHGFADLPPPNLAMACADGRYVYRRHRGFTDVVLIRSADAAVAARVLDPRNPADPLSGRVIWRRDGDLADVVNELLRAFYPAQHWLGIASQTGTY